MSTLTDPSLNKLFRLDERVAVVTGGAGLLGAEFCRTLAGAGARVVIADLDLAAAKKLAKSIKTASDIRGIAASGAALAIQADVTDPGSVQNMVETALQSYGRLDILVNSAALDPKFDPKHTSEQLSAQSSGAFENYPLEAWNQALHVNLTGAFLSCQAAVKPMLAAGKGVIINLSSIYGLAGPDQRIYQSPKDRKGEKQSSYKPAYYSVTKAGIIGLTRYLATYYAGANIRVNTLTPGGVYNHHNQDFVNAYSARAVIGRMAEKDEMNGALLFLASDASAYMTGANLVVDGGWTAW